MKRLAIWLVVTAACYQSPPRNPSTCARHQVSHQFLSVNQTPASVWSDPHRPAGLGKESQPCRVIWDFLDSFSPTTTVGVCRDSTDELGSGKHCS